MTPDTRSPHASLDGHLTDRDVRILEDLQRYRLLTTRHLQRLHFAATPFGSHTSVPSATRATTRVLGRLETRGAIVRLQRRIGGVKHGSALAVWQLGPAGERYLRARSGDTTRRRYLEPSRTFLAHTLATADVAVLLRERSNAHHFDLLELEPEPECWRPFTGPGGEPISLKPDLLTVTADPTTETHSFVEVDRATEHLPKIIRKCLVYQRYHDTGIEQQRRGVFPAAIWIVPDATRAIKIRDAIAGDARLDAGLFWTITPDQTLAHLAPYPAPTI